MSGVVREAVREYAARSGSLGEDERVRMLEVFDAVVPRVPPRPLTASPALDFGSRVVLDQVLTIALSFVFLHHGLGRAG